MSENWTPKVGDRVLHKAKGDAEWIGTVIEPFIENPGEHTIAVRWETRDGKSAAMDNCVSRSHCHPKNIEPLPAEEKPILGLADAKPGLPGPTDCLWPACGAEAMFTSSYCEQHDKDVNKGKCACPSWSPVHQPECRYSPEKWTVAPEGTPPRVMIAGEEKPYHPDGTPKGHMTNGMPYSDVEGGRQARDPGRQARRDLKLFVLDSKENSADFYCTHYPMRGRACLTCRSAATKAWKERRGI